ncbi:MAG: hypothetical protein K2O85_09285, partial [Helicobacter sp.]|nr:hypothetical protein [Helicobacter sp.]
CIRISAITTRKSLKISLKFRIFLSFCLCKLSSKYYSAFGLFDSAYLSLRACEADVAIECVGIQCSLIATLALLARNDRQKLFIRPLRFRLLPPF